MKHLLLVSACFFSLSVLALSPVGTASPAPTSTTTADDVARKTKEAVGTTVDYAKESKDEFELRMQKNLRAAQKAIHDLKSKAKKSKSATQKQMNRQIADLEHKQNQLKSRLAEVGSSSSTAWHDLASGVTKAWHDVKASANKAADDFHTDDQVTDH